jgi:hypothetical protein
VAGGTLLPTRAGSTGFYRRRRPRSSVTIVVGRPRKTPGALLGDNRADPGVTPPGRDEVRPVGGVTSQSRSTSPAPSPGWPSSMFSPTSHVRKPRAGQERRARLYAWAAARRLGGR